MSILDQVTAKRSLARSRPITARALFVLRLAQKLGEPTAVDHYADLARKHTDETLLLAYRHTLNHGHPPRDLARKFHEELASTKEQDPNQQTDEEDERSRMLAIKVERRSIAVAVFLDTKLDYHDIHYLCDEPDKAMSSVMSFLDWVIRNFRVGSATLELMTNGHKIRRAILNEVVLASLRDNLIPVWQVSKRDLLHAYGHPPLKSRSELRRASQAILWSMFNTAAPRSQELDAAALGLYVQTERLFLK